MTREELLVERITYITKIALGEGLNKDFTEFMLQAAIKAAKVGYSFAVDEASEWLERNVADIWSNPCNPDKIVEQFKRAMKGEYMKEDYCSPEIVKLLKEKGFKYSKGFVKDGDGFVGGLVRHEDKITHQMGMKWLREMYKIDIFIDTDFPIDRMKYTYKIVRIYKDGDKYTDVMGGSFDTYEEAVEAALKYSLENLI